MLNVLVPSLIAVCVLSVCTYVVMWRRRVTTHLIATTYRAAVAEKALADQGMLANEVAHELKNPVTAIVCAAQALEMLMDSTLDPSQRSALRHIKEHGEYVLKLMQDFIDVTRGSCGHLHSNKERTPAHDIARSVIGILDPIATKKKVNLEMRAQSDDLWLSIDQKHLKQILFNVIHNAIKFTPTGGSVTVTVSRVAEGSPTGKPSICLSVTDTGCGIAAHRLSTLFDARENFRQSSGSEEGCGLGLPLTKTLVDIEGGELQIQSEEGKGTNVSVVFPGLESEISFSRAAENVTLSDLPLAGQRVLVVEDDPGLRDAVSGLIRSLGGIVDGVSEAVQALEAVQRSPYSTVVIDEYVGGMSADDVAQLIKKEPGAHGAHIVVTSSGSFHSDTEEGQIVGEPLQKPFGRNGLVASLLQRAT